MSFQEFPQLFHQNIIHDGALAHPAFVRYLGQHLAGQKFQVETFLVPAWFLLATAANSPAAMR
jgi:hypothetical protein